MSHTEKKHDQYYEMANAPISHIIPKLAAPTIVSMLISSIYNMADTFFVSQLGTSASGAVGVIFSAMSIIQALAFMIGMGSGNYMTRSLGAGKRELAEQIVSIAFFTGIIMGLVITVSATFNIHRVVLLLGATETIAPYAEAYAHYIFIAAPFMICSFIMNNLLRFQGKASFAMVGITVGGLLNIALDPLFIFTLDMGTAGAALATGLSQFISFCILLWMCNHQDSCISISIRKFRLTLVIYREVLYGGIPSLGRQGIASVATILMNFMCQPYGDAAIAAMSIVSRFMFFINSVIIGFGQGFQPVLGFNFGAGRLDRVKRALVFSIQVCTAFLIVAAVAGYIFAPAIVTEFRRSDPQVIAIGTRAFRAQCFSLPLLAVCVFANMYFQSVGKAFRATILAVCRNGVMIPLVYVLCWRFGLTGLEWTQTLADVVSFAISAGIFVQYFRREFGREDLGR